VSNGKQPVAPLRTPASSKASFPRSVKSNSVFSGIRYSGFPLAALRAYRSEAGRNSAFGFRISFVIRLPRRSRTQTGHSSFVIPPVASPGQ